MKTKKVKIGDLANGEEVNIDKDEFDRVIIGGDRVVRARLYIMMLEKVEELGGDFNISQRELYELIMNDKNPFPPNIKKR